METIKDQYDSLRIIVPVAENIKRMVKSIHDTDTKESYDAIIMNILFSCLNLGKRSQSLDVKLEDHYVCLYKNFLTQDDTEITMILFYASEIKKTYIDESIFLLDTKEVCKLILERAEPGTVEYFFLGCLVNLYKLRNNLPTIYKNNIEIIRDCPYNCADFTGMDFSKSRIKRRVNGCLKGLILKSCNFSHTTLIGDFGYGWNMTGSNLKHSNFSQYSRAEELILIKADVEGAFFGVDYIPDRRSLNYDKICKE